MNSNSKFPMISALTLGFIIWGPNLTSMFCWFGPKPAPASKTFLLDGPVDWASVRPGTTWKMSSEPRAIPEEPITTIVWRPAVEAGTTREEVNAPCESDAIPDRTGVPSKDTEIPCSLAPNPFPVMAIVEPGLPELVLKATSVSSVRVLV